MSKWIAIIAGMLMSTVAYAQPRHVLFCFVDHFEPHPARVASDVQHWVDGYPALEGHVDADGRPPQHTWHLWYSRNIRHVPGEALPMLNELTYDGWGEVEFHLHMGVPDERTRPPAEAVAEFALAVGEAKDLWSRCGAMISLEEAPQVRFGFIHGMWALDNSRWDYWTDPADPRRAWCGVNEQLRLLRLTGCYADYTFPAWGPMQPNQPNTILAVTDDPEPASYQNQELALPLAVGMGNYDLMLVQGPGNAGYDPDRPPSLSRMHGWVGANVHVEGQPDWVFVKVHTHGLMYSFGEPRTASTFFGERADEFYTDIEDYYNDGVDWALHYVTAREMHNIALAAADGQVGDPNDYRDYAVKPPANTRILARQPYRLLTYTPQWCVVEILYEPSEVIFTWRGFSKDAVVEEADEPFGPWVETDAERAGIGKDELWLDDGTPSRFYRLSHEGFQLMEATR